MDLKDFVEEGYAAMAQAHDYESREAKFTVTLSAEHKFMLEEISAIFNQSLTGFAGQLLEDAVNEMVLYLGLTDFEKAAKSAEQKTLEHYKKIYDTYENAGDVTRWPYMAKCLSEKAGEK